MATPDPETKDDVSRMLDRVEATSASSELETLFTKLHASTRVLESAVLEPLFSKRGVRILGLHGFSDKPGPEHLPALRCLNNVLVRSAESRPMVATEVGADRIVAAFKRADPDDELALANILIFACYGTSLDLKPSFEKDGLADAINSIIARNAEQGSLPTAEPTSACSASLRLLSTLGATYESQTDRFLDSVDPVMEMLTRTKVPSPPLQPSVSLLVNCLPFLPLQKKTDISVAAVDKLTEILGASLAAYGTMADEHELQPLLLGLLNLSQSAGGSQAKTRLQTSLVPGDEDRKEALGKGATLPHKILGLASSSMSPEVRELVMSLFFELSDRDPSRFVHNVGFGNAAGYLSTKGIDISQSATASAEAGGAAINPITGQRIDFEAKGPDLPEMTDEEKEREAERLFVLFERATGVVDVENPVTRAAREGRIQELPDDESDDDKT
ncbi:hypothetical protein GMORB2_2868 [Geosmithia morbida]|uniref:Uncharacterized protein n=1 Tax=Geosmithia morbida TaxID=1094350 RepID=A0A9P4YPY6_9HYPO|nr:uncharacterized protein GMORB2_2868 [Geosmithia morbida]KAF4120432.1 hypothetical protein GMORB2_2868 [Geosmithia morbida]